MKPLQKDLKSLLSGKIYISSSAGVIMLSEFGKSHTNNQWTRGLKILPIVSFVHWSSDFKDELRTFKQKNINNKYEYILLPETEFVIKKFDL